MLAAPLPPPEDGWWREGWTSATCRIWFETAIRHGWRLGIVADRTLGSLPIYAVLASGGPLPVQFVRWTHRPRAPSWRLLTRARRVMYVLAMPDGTLHHWGVPRWVYRAAYVIRRMPPGVTVPWPSGRAVSEYFIANLMLRA